MWAIVSNEKTTLQTFAEYGLRFDIEENFLDVRSAGWNVQRSMIRDVRALSCLWFILSVATLYVSAQGVEVVRTEKKDGLILIGLEGTVISESAGIGLKLPF